MIATTVANLLAHKRRLLGAALAVVLGVAFLSATLTLGATLRGGFGDLFDSADAGTAAVVRNPTQVGDGNAQARGLVDPGLVAAAASVPGVAAAVPEVDGTAQMLGTDGQPIGGGGPPTLAGSWLGSSPLNPYHLVAGRAPVARAAGPVEVVIDRRSARAGHLAVGRAVTVLTPQPVRAVVVGLAGFGSGDSMAGATYTAFSLSDAQRILLVGRPQVSQVRVAAEPGVSQAELARRLRAALPAHTQVVTGHDLAREQQRDVEGSLVDPLETFLLIFAGVAVLVATFSIANTFTILAAQRTRACALLRAIGASRLQVLASSALEALVVGVVASVVGVAAGIGLAAGLHALLGASGTGLPVSSLVVPASAGLLAGAIGLATTLVASVVPAVRASRVAPVAAMRDVATGRRSIGRARLAVGASAAAAGLAALLAGATGSGDVALAGLGALVTLGGAVLVGPAVTRPVSAVLGRPLRLVHGISGELAQLNTARQARRSSAAASALMIGVGVVVLFTVFAASIKTSLDRSVGRSFRGDLVVSPVGAGTDTGLSPGVVATLAHVPQVRAAAGLANGAVTLAGSSLAATVADPGQLAAVTNLHVRAGSLSRLGGDQLAVSVQWADQHRWQLGTPVAAEWADGATQTLRVGAVYRDRGVLGDVILPASAFQAHATAPPTDVAVLVGFAPGVEAAVGRAEVTGALAPFEPLQVQDRQEFTASVGAQVDQLLKVVDALLAMAVLIAVLGIANTLSLSIHERARELGLLRAVGQSRRQLRSMLRDESLIVALFGTLGGLLLGSLAAWALVRAGSSTLNLDGFSVPVAPLLVVLAVGAAAGLAAGWRPARRAARMAVLEAVTTD